MEQQNCKPWLICNSIQAPGAVTPAVNNSSDKASAPKAIQFVRFMELILYRVWEADSKEVPVWLSKWDISNAFHWCNLQQSEVGKCSYMLPLVPSDTSSLLYVDLVLPMEWVNSPYFF